MQQHARGDGRPRVALSVEEEARAARCARPRPRRARCGAVRNGIWHERAFVKVGRPLGRSRPSARVILGRASDCSTGLRD